MKKSPANAGRNDVVRLACISDTHQMERELELPDGDILLHAGDFTMFSRSARAIFDFSEWLDELPYAHKIVVPGNHEFFLEADPSRRNLISTAIVLINEGIEVMGLKIWGTPTTPLEGGAFGVSSPAKRAKIYSEIPDDVDILISHGPPFGILDRAPDSPHHAGCLELLKAVTRVKPRLHLFGHAHMAYGVMDTENTLYVNAALMGLDGDLSKAPISLRMPRI